MSLFNVFKKKTLPENIDVPSWPPISPRRYEPPHYAYLAVRTSPEQDAQTTGLTLDSYFFFQKSPSLDRFAMSCYVLQEFWQ